MGPLNDRTWQKLVRRTLLISNLCAPIAILLTKFGVAWVVAAGGVVHALLIFAIVNPQCGWLGPVVTRFIPRRREVWLTIDDGVAGAESVQLAREMERRGVTATFFVKGETLAGLRAEAAQVQQAGHTLANHTHTHPALHFWCLLPWRLRRELDACNEALAAAGVPRVDWFRSPVGLKHALLHRELARRRMRLIAWSLRGRDGIVSNPKAVARRVIKRVRPGTILLLHEGRARSVETILLVIEELQRRGYQFVIPEDAQLV